MSSSADAGYYAEKARQKSEEKCSQSPTGMHVSVKVSPGSPSSELKCKHCGAHLGYSK